MRDRAGNLVLPRYNNAAPGTMVFSQSTSTNGSLRGGGLPLEQGDSILLDIEGGGTEMSDGGASLSKSSQATWWRPDLVASPIKTAVFTNLGSALSSGWSRARGVVLGSSVTSYIRRVPALEKPFDLNEIHHPGDPNDIYKQAAAQLFV